MPLTEWQPRVAPTQPIKGYYAAHPRAQTLKVLKMKTKCSSVT